MVWACEVQEKVAFPTDSIGISTGVLDQMSAVTVMLTVSKMFLWLRL